MYTVGLVSRQLLCCEDDATNMDGIKTAFYREALHIDDLSHGWELGWVRALPSNNPDIMLVNIRNHPN